MRTHVFIEDLNPYQVERRRVKVVGVYVSVAEGNGLLGNLCVQLPWCSLCASLGQMLSFAAGQIYTQGQELCPTDWDGESLCAHSWAAPVSLETSLGPGVHRIQQPTFTSLTYIIQIHFFGHCSYQNEVRMCLFIFDIKCENPGHSWRNGNGRSVGPLTVRTRKNNATSC